MLHFFEIIFNYYIFNRKMENLKEHLEQRYGGNYTGLVTDLQNIALEYARLSLYSAREKGVTNERASQNVRLLQLIAKEIERLANH